MKRGLFTLTIILLLSASLNIAFAHYFWWFGERPPPFDPSTYDPVIVEPKQRDLAVMTYAATSSTAARSVGGDELK